MDTLVLLVVSYMFFLSACAGLSALNSCVEKYQVGNN